MIPREEVDNFAIIVDDAFSTAATYSRSLGYLKLLRGEERCSEARAAGEPWVAELEERYRRALERFREEFGSPE